MFFKLIFFQTYYYFGRILSSNKTSGNSPINTQLLWSKGGRLLTGCTLRYSETATLLRQHRRENVTHCVSYMLSHEDFVLFISSSATWLPLSLPFHCQTQTSTFQTNLWDLFQVLTTENLSCLLQPTDLSSLWVFITCFPYLKTQYLSMNSHT